MDPPAKEGPLLVQQSHKFGTKRWKRSWFVLYPASQHGVARLEFFDCKEPSAPPERLGTRRLARTVVRLADCTSVGPVAESGPRPGTAAFRLETSERSYLFAADKQQSEEWVAKLCEIAFPGNGPSDAGVAARRGREDSGEAPALEMAVNSIYYSRDEVNTFWVTVQRTEAAERCELRGAYMLKAECDSLVLKDPRTNEILYVWPYRLLRRYGRDKVMFSFEAGRRCESGPGNFTFETKQGNEIFRLVEASIREQKAQVEENRQSCDSLESDSPSVVLIRQALADSLTLELPAEGARPTGEAWRTQGHDGRGGYEYPYNPSTDDYSVPAFPAKAKGPKPVPAPKPQAALIPKGAERSGDAGKRRGNAAPERGVVKPGLNSSNNNNVEVLYSRVLKLPHTQKKEQSVDECSLSPVYEDLGEI
ncbi:unnamed protein product [Bubo scandiacus]